MQQGARIELLGTPRLVLPSGEPHVLERRDAALLAWLALHGPTPRSRIAGLLWPDSATRAAQTNLRQRLFRLKQRAGAEIVVSEPVLALALAAGVVHDLAPGQAASAAAPANNGAQVLLGSLDFEDCGELAAWVAMARERWAAECRDRLARHAAECEAQGRIAEAIALAERLIVEAPTAEHAHRRLMRLHYRRGDRAAALAAFGRCREALAVELRTQPGAETRELAALIERSGDLPPPVAAAPSPVAVLRPPRLIGREREWRAIEAAWQRRQPVLLLGEPGIGKSRLAADFAAAQQQPNVYRAHPGDALMPYSLLARLLRGLIERFGAPPQASIVPQAWIVGEFARLLPELGPQPVGKLEPLRLRHAVTDALAQWQAQGLAAIVIDDLHFADEASLEWLLAWLAQGGHPQLVLTVRTGEIPQTLSQWVRDHDSQRVCEVTLAALDVAGVAALLDSLAIPQLDGAAWAEPLARRTGGNPLFILETLRAALAAGPIGPVEPGVAAPHLAAPAQVGALLERRLTQLPPEALRLARVAALAGPDFSIELAAQVLRIHVLDLCDGWLALEHAQVIRDGAFAHDLMLDATLRSVPEAIATVLHRAMADALERSPKTTPARVGHHWRCAHEWARAAPQFEVAARAAQAASRPAEALALWDSAADCHARAGATDAAFLARYEAIEAAIVAEPASRVRARAGDLVATGGSDSERLWALIALGRHLATGSNFAQTLPVTAEALALACKLHDRRREFIVVNVHGVALAMTGQVNEGLRLFEGLAQEAGELGGDAIECEFCSSFAYALHAAGRLRDAALWMERAADMAGRLGDTNMQAINVGNLSRFQSLLGQGERSLDTALRSQALQMRMGELHGEPYAISLMNIGLSYLVAGRLGEALASFEQAFEVARGGAAARLACAIEGHLANTYVQLGQPARARQALSALPDDAPAAPRMRRRILEWRIDALAAPVGAERLLQALESFHPKHGTLERLGLELAIAAALPADESIAWAQRTRAAALASGHRSVALSALARLASGLHRSGEHAAAAAAAREAVAEANESSCYDMPAIELWWIAFQALDAAGDTDAALQALAIGARAASAALAHVPDAFRHGYLNRSPVVPQLMAMARRRLGAAH